MISLQISENVQVLHFCCSRQVILHFFCKIGCKTNGRNISQTEGKNTMQKKYYAGQAWHLMLFVHLLGTAMVK